MKRQQRPTVELPALRKGKDPYSRKPMLCPWLRGAAVRYLGDITLPDGVMVDRIAADYPGGWQAFAEEVHSIPAYKRERLEDRAVNHPSAEVRELARQCIGDLEGMDRWSWAAIGYQVRRW